MTTQYRCTTCHAITTAPNFSDQSFVDYDGEINHMHVPVCECGSTMKRLTGLSAAIIEVAGVRL